MPLTSVFSEVVDRQTAVNTEIVISAGTLWFVQVGGISNTRFSQLGVHSLRSNDELGIGFNADFQSEVLYSAVTGFTWTLPDQIPSATIWLYVAKSCPIASPVMTVYIFT